MSHQFYKVHQWNMMLAEDVEAALRLNLRALLGRDPTKDDVARAGGHCIVLPGGNEKAYIFDGRVVVTSIVDAEALQQCRFRYVIRDYVAPPPAIDWASCGCGEV